jgi:hypothetical protein
MAASDVPDKRELDHQFERISWALFLIMLGGLGLVPGVPSGTWLIGTGLIMLGLNIVRYLNDIPVSRFTILLGFAAMAFGLVRLVGADLPVLPILLILIGASIIWRSARAHQQGYRQGAG